MYDAFLMRIQRRNLAPAAPHAVTMRSVDLWVGFAEVASESTALRSESNPSCLAGPGIRRRLSFIASASDVIRLGTRWECPGIRTTAD
jgi:hypothetical protein